MRSAKQAASSARCAAHIALAMPIICVAWQNHSVAAGMSVKQLIDSIRLHTSSARASRCLARRSLRGCWRWTAFWAWTAGSGCSWRRGCPRWPSASGCAARWRRRRRPPSSCAPRSAPGSRSAMRPTRLVSRLRGLCIGILFILLSTCTTLAHS